MITRIPLLTAAVLLFALQGCNYYESPPAQPSTASSSQSKPQQNNQSRNNTRSGRLTVNSHSGGSMVGSWAWYDGNPERIVWREGGESVTFEVGQDIYLSARDPDGIMWNLTLQGQNTGTFTTSDGESGSFIMHGF